MMTLVLLLAQTRRGEVPRTLYVGRRLCLRGQRCADGTGCDFLFHLELFFGEVLPFLSIGHLV